jgi:hypothetical protein
MGDGSKIVMELGEMFMCWEFSFIDVRGRSGGVIIGWNTRPLLYTNTLCVDLGLVFFFTFRRWIRSSWFSTYMDHIMTSGILGEDI